MLADAMVEKRPWPRLPPSTRTSTLNFASTRGLSISWPRAYAGIGPKDLAASVGLDLLFEELTRCSLFNYIAQPHKLIYASIA